MRTLVTGATGFIGRHVVRRLLERGEPVKCLVRRQPKNGLAASGVEFVRGDVTQPDSLRAAVRGVDLIYHIAGATQVHSPAIYARVNSDGTRHLAEACARLPTPPKVVYVSSLAAAGPSSDDCPRREDQLSAPVSAYGKSKLAAEGHLRKLAGRIPVTIVRPPAVFGPWDPNTIQLFRSVRTGFNVVPGQADPRLSIIFVEDLVSALLLAAERGKTITAARTGPEAERGIYFTAMEESIAFSEMAQAAARAMNLSAIRTVRLPGLLCWLGAYANQFRATLLHQPILFTPDKIREAFAGSWTCSSEKAKVELGMRCTTGLVDGFRVTVDWYRRQGWL